MVSIYINGVRRDDIRIEAGGSLEQTSDHTTSSSLSIQVPVASDNLQDCDYIQLYDGEQLIFAGTILKLNQASFSKALSWRIYDLDIAGNADLVSAVYVDLGFPQGCNINQILFGNSSQQSSYDPDLGEFSGVIPMRIIPEGITVGVVDDFSSYVLEEPAYLWGKTVRDLLDELASTAGAWWEITQDKIFNMRSSSNLPLASFQVDQSSRAFDVSASKDALTFYSACRVLGGTGSSIPTDDRVSASQPAGADGQQVLWREDETVIMSGAPIRSAYSIRQTLNGQPIESSTTPGIIRIGYTGLHDDDPTYQALMTSGGTDITLKDGIQLVDPAQSGYAITITDISYEIDVYARVVDPDLQADIASRRGGTGIVEYTLEDDTITSFSAAVLAAQSFLRNNAQRAVELSFSTFSPCYVGQVLTVDLPYYGLSGTYKITQVTISFLLNRADGLVAQYDVVASNIKYRDPYKALWYTPPKTTFALKGSQPAEDGIYIPSDIEIKTSINAYASLPVTWQDIHSLTPSWSAFQAMFTSWQGLQGRTSPYTWTQIQQMYPTWRIWGAQVPNWAFLERIQQGWYYMGNYLTAAGREMLVKFLSGENPTTATDFFGPICLSGSQFSEMLEPQDITMLPNGGVTTFYVPPDEIQNVINSISINQGNIVSGDPLLTATVDIDHTGSTTGGTFALTIAVRTIIE